MEQIDLLVFAPHPDDECIACAGVMLAAQASGKRLRVVFLTNGEGYPHAAALQLDKPIASLRAPDYLKLGQIRQTEALHALAQLGISATEVIFLAYPDGYLPQVYQADSAASVVSQKSLQQQTYALQVTDYHSQRHGQPAPYQRLALLADLCELFQRFQPKAVYYPSRKDSHPDHQAAAWFIEDAMQQSQFAGERYRYLIHAATTQSWPLPRGANPQQRFAAATQDLELPWPPKLRHPVSVADNHKKLAAINTYASQLRVAGEQEYLHAFIKAEEVFW